MPGTPATWKDTGDNPATILESLVSRSREGEMLLKAPAYSVCR